MNEGTDEVGEIYATLGRRVEEGDLARSAARSPLTLQRLGS